MHITQLKHSGSQTLVTNEIIFVYKLDQSNANICKNINLN